MKSPTSIVSDFVIEKLLEEPVHRRIAVTRALAKMEPCKKRQASLNAIANRFEAIERAHDQLLLNFRRNNS